MVDSRLVGNASIRLRLLEAETAAIKNQIINSGAAAAQRIVSSGRLDQLREELERCQEAEIAAREVVTANRIHFEGTPSEPNKEGTRTLQIAEICNRNKARQDYLDLTIARKNADSEARLKKLELKREREGGLAAGAMVEGLGGGGLNPFARKPMNFVNMWDLSVRNADAKVGIATKMGVDVERLESDETGKIVVTQNTTKAERSSAHNNVGDKNAKKNSKLTTQTHFAGLNPQKPWSLGGMGNGTTTNAGKVDVWSMWKKAQKVPAGSPPKVGLTRRTPLGSPKLNPALAAFLAK